MKRCYSTIRAFNKQQGESGGLSHILIKNAETIIRIQDKEEMEHHLFERNRKHFSQAHGTPCASGSLATILGNDGHTMQTKKKY